MNFAIIPQPKTITSGEGQFVIASQTSILVDPGAEPVANYLANLLRHATGYAIPVNIGATEQPDAIEFRLTANDASLGREGYRLAVSGRQVKIEAKEMAGLFYAVQTLRQLLPPAIEGRPQPLEPRIIPAVRIEDMPRFSWRGLLLDVSRHFFPVAFIKKFLDVMALYKFNVLHWHLTDDQGWRIEIKHYPRLTEVGSQRAESPIPLPRTTLREPNRFRKEGDGKPHGGFYTQQDIKEIVSYAQQLFITVVPEIEMPGHSLAALTSYPELGCVGKDYQVRTTWGIADDLLCPGKEQTFDFVNNVLAEVLELFPSKYIHIGGDECPTVRWEACPLCQATIRRERLKNEHELHSYFIRRVEQTLEARGRHLIGWDEILEGGLAPKATVMSWRGTKGGIEAAAAGHDVIMTPTTHCYFDYYQSEDVTNEPPAIRAYLPLEQVYAFDPLEGVPADAVHHILGGQGNLWTEYMPTESQVEYMAYPRAMALADAVWSAGPRHNFEDFSRRMQAHLPRLDRLEVNYCKP